MYNQWYYVSTNDIILQMKYFCEMIKDCHDTSVINKC